MHTFRGFTRNGKPIDIEDVVLILTLKTGRKLLEVRKAVLTVRTKKGNKRVMFKMRGGERRKKVDINPTLTGKIDYTMIQLGMQLALGKKVYMEAQRTPTWDNTRVLHFTVGERE